MVRRNKHSKVAPGLSQIKQAPKSNKSTTNITSPAATKNTAGSGGWAIVCWVKTNKNYAAGASILTLSNVQGILCCAAVTVCVYPSLVPHVGAKLGYAVLQLIRELLSHL